MLALIVIVGAIVVGVFLAICGMGFFWALFTAKPTPEQIAAANARFKV